MHCGAMERTPDMSQRLLACLSDTSRYRIVRLLREEERCVTEIAQAVGLSQSCTTRHLQALARRRVVRRRREGKKVLFRLDDRDPDVRGLLAWLGAPAGPARGCGAEGPPSTAESRAGSPAGVRGRRAGRSPLEADPDRAGSRAPEPGPAVAKQPPGEARRDDPDTDDAVEDVPSKQVPPLRPGDLEDYLL